MQLLRWVRVKNGTKPIPVLIASKTKPIQPVNVNVIPIKNNSENPVNIFSGILLKPF